MNQKCKVCGEPAAGFHFGAFTCEGCKSFFGRTYSNVSAIGECKNGGQCVINKKNRTSCKACRLRKCLLVGMSKSGSRYGRRSNWFKIHCLLQEQTGLETPLGSNPLGSNVYHNMNTLSPETHETSRTTPDGVCTNDVHTSSSSSSVTSSRDSTNGDDDTSKENLRLLLTTSPNLTSDSAYLKRNSLRRSSPRCEELLTGKSSLKNVISNKTGLLAMATPIDILKNSESSSSSPSPQTTTSPKSIDSNSHHSKPCDHPGPFPASAHPFYQLLTLGQHQLFLSPHSVKEEESMKQNLYKQAPEQEGPIDLSCKTQPVCHIRAEILADIHLLKENDASPLDLTTKG